jgi:4-hydroxybenzoate polyprenyltransferase
MSGDIVPDTQHRGLIARLPAPLRDYAQLARLDRPIGFWLLFWPCAWGVLLAGGMPSLAGGRWGLLAWLWLGAVAMRGAGCVYNDIVDADIDRQVARTASRPVASGRVGKRAAWVWLLVLCSVGLLVLLQLRWQAQVVALGSLTLVAAYPFMKRITGFPQGWLGLVFTWGVPVGWVEVRGFDGLGVMAALYAGAVCWCIGYDTIYALQDREDDAMIGVGSSALTLGRHVKAGVAGFYAAAVVCWGSAICIPTFRMHYDQWHQIRWDWTLDSEWSWLEALVPVALHLTWQVVTLHPEDAANALARFRANHFAGLLMALACWWASATVVFA